MSLWHFGSDPSLYIYLIECYHPPGENHKLCIQCGTRGLRGFEKRVFGCVYAVGKSISQ